MAYPLTNDESAGQYRMDVDGTTAFIEYTKEGDVLILTHTEVPENLAGQGIGHQLVKETLDDISQNQQKIVPVCPFVVEYIQENPQYSKLVI